MPQGKGTYGSKVGRPPKKKKYQAGGSVDPFSTRNPAGIPAKMDMDAIEEQNNLPTPNALEGQNEFPTSNAMDRSEVSPMGAEVGTGVYKEGGFIKRAVEKYKSKKEGKKREKARKKAVKDFPITGIVQPKKKGLKPAVVSSNPPLIPHYGAKGRSSIENLITDSVYGKDASKKRYEKKKGKKK